MFRTEKKLRGDLRNHCSFLISTGTCSQLIPIANLLCLLCVCLWSIFRHRAFWRQKCLVKTHLLILLEVLGASRLSCGFVSGSAQIQAHSSSIFSFCHSLFLVAKVLDQCNLTVTNAASQGTTTKKLQKRTAASKSETFSKRLPFIQ